MKKRLLILLIACGLILSVLPGCSKTESESEKTGETTKVQVESTETQIISTAKQETDSSAQPETKEKSDEKFDASLKGEITHWVWGDYEEKGASEFNNYYPDIKVNYVVFPSEDYITKFQTTLAGGGDLPDVFNADVEARPLLFEEDIWEVFDDEPYNIDLSQLIDFSIPLLQNQKGQTVCVQIDNCVGGYAYKRDLAKEYFGTDDPEELEAIFQTPEDYIKMAKEVNEKSGGEVFLFGAMDDIFRSFSSLGKSSAQPLVIGDKLNIREAYKDCFDVMAKMVENNGIGPYVGWTPAWQSSFASGEVIFFPGPTWFLTWVIQPNDPEGAGNYGVIDPPGGSFSWGGTGYCIPRDSKNKDLAWAYISWLTMSQEGSESFFKAQATPTLFKPSYETDLYIGNNDPYYNGQDIIEKFIKISQNPETIVRSATKYDGSIIGSIGPVFIEMRDNQLSAADAMDMFEDECLKNISELTK